MGVALLVAGCATSGPRSPEAEPAARAVLVVAHRGASGYLPEHTLAAYALAYAQGADFLEPDVVLTRDGIPIARHDLTLEATTDVRERFPGRARADGHVYAADFDLAEIRRLEARAPRPGRFPRDATGFPVPTLDEVLRLVAELDRLTGCRVGVYPELKRPDFHAAAGLDLEEAVVAALGRHGFGGAGRPVFLQSFDPKSLERVRFELGSDLPLVQLVPEGESGAALLDAAGLEQVARYADAIGPGRAHLAGAAGAALVARAHALGLAVHPWTFRADAPAGRGVSFEEEIRGAVALGVDGLFTDHPDRARAALDALGRSTRDRCKVR